MADTTTTNLGLTKPEIGASANTWGTKLNADLDAIDALFPSGDLAVVNGGTGSSTASGARTNLGAAAIASPAFTGTPTAPTAASGTNTTQIATTAFVQTAKQTATITSGTITGITDLAIADGGTGASDAATARSNLGTNNASNLTTGTVGTARLGSGTADSSTFLRGDGAWTDIETQVKSELNASGVAPVYGCRAWVNFDGTKDSTGASSTANTNRFIRASGNVTSVLRNGTGDYTVNFTTSMPDGNYAAVTSNTPDGSGSTATVAGISTTAGSLTSSSVRVESRRRDTGATVESTLFSVAIFR